jgi:hypothetical protein
LEWALRDEHVSAGNLLAVAGISGIQLFHFNGAAPVTDFGGLLYESLPFDQVMWDSKNHLYVLSYALHLMRVFTVTTTSVKEVTGSPYNLPQSPYGTKGLIVVPK